MHADPFTCCRCGVPLGDIWYDSAFGPLCDDCGDEDRIDPGTDPVSPRTQEEPSVGLDTMAAASCVVDVAAAAVRAFAGHGHADPARAFADVLHALRARDVLDGDDRPTPLGKWLLAQKERG